MSILASNSFASNLSNTGFFETSASVSTAYLGGGRSIIENLTVSWTLKNGHSNFYDKFSNFLRWVEEMSFLLYLAPFSRVFSENYPSKHPFFETLNLRNLWMLLTSKHMLPKS